MMLMREAIALKDTALGAEKVWKTCFELVERNNGAKWTVRRAGTPSARLRG